MSKEKKDFLMAKKTLKLTLEEYGYKLSDLIYPTDGLEIAIIETIERVSGQQKKVIQEELENLQKQVVYSSDLLIKTEDELTQVKEQLQNLKSDIEIDANSHRLNYIECNNELLKVIEQNKKLANALENKWISVNNPPNDDTYHLLHIVRNPNNKDDYYIINAAYVGNGNWKEEESDHIYNNSSDFTPENWQPKPNPPSMTEEEQIRKCYDDLAKYEKEVSDHNTTIINSFGKTASKHFKNLLDFCNVTEKIELVDKPNGQRQNENYGMFKNVHVDQWSVNMEGDSYEGYIYANVKGQWIKVPFSC